MQVHIWECKWMQVPSTWWGRQKSFPSRKSRASDISYRSRRGQQPLHWGWSRCCRQPTCTGLPAHPGSPSGPGFKKKKKKRTKSGKSWGWPCTNPKYQLIESWSHWGWKRPSGSSSAIVYPSPRCPENYRITEVGKDHQPTPTMPPKSHCRSCPVFGGEPTALTRHSCTHHRPPHLQAYLIEEIWFCYHCQQQCLIDASHHLWAHPEMSTKLRGSTASQNHIQYHVPY